MSAINAYRNAKGAVVRAILFDANESTWPPRMKAWPNGRGLRPRDMSWGYLDLGDDSGPHVRHGDFVVYGPTGAVWVMTPNEFGAEFRLLNDADSTENSLQSPVLSTADTGTAEG